MYATDRRQQTDVRHHHRLMHNNRSGRCPWHYRGGMRSLFKTLSQPASSLQSVVSFLPRDAMRKSSLCCRPVSVCPSLCLSVTLVDCIQMAEDIVKLLSRPGSLVILVFLTPGTDTQFQGIGNLENWKIGKPSSGRKIQGWENLRF